VNQIFGAFGKHFSGKDTQTESKRMENDIRSNGKVEVVMFILHKVEYKSQLIGREREGHYILTNGAINQEGILIVSTYVLNNTQFHKTNTAGHKG
jgi:tetrahydromethanopterin S-methyltransferase subunit F